MRILAALLLLPALAAAETLPVVCPGLRNATATIQYRAATAPVRGTIALFSGGSGTKFVSDMDGSTWVAELRAAGLNVAQVKWASSWWQGPEGAGIVAYACRPAKVIDHLVRVATGELMLFGHSGGSSAVAYSVEYYGTSPGRVILSGGPPHARLTRSCSTDPAYEYTLDQRRAIDRSYNAGSPCELNRVTFAPRWDGDSVALSSPDYDHQPTEFFLIVGEKDSAQVRAAARAYYDRLEAADNNVAWASAPNTGHRVYATPEGRAILMGAVN